MQSYAGTNVCFMKQNSWGSQLFWTELNNNQPLLLSWDHSIIIIIHVFHFNYINVLNINKLTKSVQLSAFLSITFHLCLALLTSIFCLNNLWLFPLLYCDLYKTNATMISPIYVHVFVSAMAMRDSLWGVCLNWTRIRSREYSPVDNRVGTCFYVRFDFRSESEWLHSMLILLPSSLYSTYHTMHTHSNMFFFLSTPSHLVRNNIWIYYI
jgi:hypothetical protein